MIKVIIIEDHSLLCDSFKFLLETTQEFKVVASSAAADDAYQLCKQYQPNIVLMDIFTVKGNGLDVAGEIKKLYPQMKVFIISAIKEPILMDKAQRLQVDGYLFKDIPVEQLLSILRMAHQEYKIFPEVPDKMSRLCTFSKGELQIMQCLCEGMTLEETAATVNYSTSTVKRYIANMLERAGLQTRAQLLSHATKRGLIDPDHS